MDPVEFIPLNFDYHPRWIGRQLKDAGFRVDRVLTVSHFRLALLKRLIPTGLLAKMDGWLQYTGSWWQLTPSVFVTSQAPSKGSNAGTDDFFACPVCQTPLGRKEDAGFNCPNPACARRWRFKDGLYDFKSPAK